MKISEGSKNTNYIECISPKRNRWRIRWNFSKKDDSDDVYTFCEEDFDYKPSVEEIRNVIVGYYNQQIDNRILQGFEWNGSPVWLSSENQFNYKAAYDLAVQTNGANLPVTFKFGTDEKPEYVEFSTVDKLASFYNAAVSFVNKTLMDGWKIKDTINYDSYMI